MEAHRALISSKPRGRVFIVGGAGSLTRGGVPLTQTELVPDEYLPEAESVTHMLDLYRSSQGLDWTILTPAPMMMPGSGVRATSIGR